jgi:hypothetical protein
MTTLLATQDWDYLLAERIGIMHADPSLTEARAKALALGDTIRTHGPRPQEAL